MTSLIFSRREPAVNVSKTPRLQQQRIAGIRRKAEELIVWLADQRQPERHQTCWRPQISWYRSAWISAAFVLFERACTLKQPKNMSFPFCMVWVGGPEYVRLLISVVSVDGQDEVAFEHSMERIVGHIHAAHRRGRRDVEEGGPTHPAAGLHLPRAT